VAADSRCWLMMECLPGTTSAESHAVKIHELANALKMLHAGSRARFYHLLDEFF